GFANAHPHPEAASLRPPAGPVCLSATHRVHNPEMPRVPRKKAVGERAVKEDRLVEYPITQLQFGYQTISLMPHPSTYSCGILSGRRLRYSCHLLLVS